MCIFVIFVFLLSRHSARRGNAVEGFLKIWSGVPKETQGKNTTLLLVRITYPFSVLASFSVPFLCAHCITEGSSPLQNEEWQFSSTLSMSSLSGMDTVIGARRFSIFLLSIHPVVHRGAARPITSRKPEICSSCPRSHTRATAARSKRDMHIGVGTGIKM